MMVVMVLHRLALGMLGVPASLRVTLASLGDVFLAGAVGAHGEGRNHLFQPFALAPWARRFARAAHQRLEALAAILTLEIVDGHYPSLLHPM